MTEPIPPATPKRSPLRLLLIILCTVVITVAVTVWLVRIQVFQTEFKPVALSADEESTLASKLSQIEGLQQSPAPAAPGKEGAAQDNTALTPEPYSEVGASRSVTLSERELNGLLAKNTDMARKLAIDLSDDLLSARLLVPVDEDFPVFGGQVLKVRAGMELAYDHGHAVAKLRGVTVLGVALPNAWLGGMKDIDLVEHYGNQAGFWRAFSAGVEDLHIEDGSITLKLRE